ncbi:S24 family peptidase [Sphingomonas sp. RB3P16]|uniref:XRE family transcriptional regulator n=1 Tax=Parasphingomonas frigoris TaxID=3096163 RepID=UPI002FCB9537
MSSDILSANIRTLREHLGLNQAEFAERVGAKQFQVSKWETLGQEPTARTLIAVAALAGVDPIEFMDTPWSPLEGSRPSASTLPAINAPVFEDDVVEIVSLDLSLSMGPGTLIEDFVESETIKMDLALVQGITRTPSDRLRLVKGIGDSMEPTLRTGDHVLIDINEKSLSKISGIYWIDYHGSHGIKRLRPASRQRVRIISDNPGEEDFEVDAEDLRIEGRVIWFAREL